MRKFIHLCSWLTLTTALPGMAASFISPVKTATMPSLCKQDSIITTQDAELRNNWAFRCGHLDKTNFQAQFADPEHKKNYPLFAQAGTPYSAVKPDYASCTLPAGAVFYEVCENGFLVYDGKAASFGVGQNWDVTNSQVKALDTAAGMRFTLNNKNQWAAAAYVFHRDWSHTDFGPYARLHLRMKNSGYGATLRVLVYLVDMDGHGESIRLPQTIDRTFHDYILDLDQFSLNGFNTSQSQALVVAVSEADARTYAVDIDRISAD